MSEDALLGQRIAVLNLFGKEFARGILLARQDGKLVIQVDGESEPRTFNSPPAQAIPEPPAPVKRPGTRAPSTRVPTLRAPRKGAFVFWTSSESNPWLLREASIGRLRQGWGLPSVNLVDDGKPVPWARWRERYAHDATTYWQGLSSDEEIATRFEILQRMLSIVPGDLILVPHFESVSGFTLVKATERYRHDGGGPADRLPGGPDHDFGHIIGVDWDGRRTYEPTDSEAAAYLISKFSAYRSAVNVVQNDDYARIMLGLFERS